jgi:D-glycero-D-manno-heptose 1,7-bisphosphate phosphatase
LNGALSKSPPVVLLDRDGVINRDSPDYIKHWGEFEFLPRSLEAIRRLTETGFAVIVVTNQSIVGRKMVSPETLAHTHRMMCQAVKEAGGQITDIFFCPHTPDDHCSCRKPEPGLILSACRRYRIDPGDTFMVGDSATDIECARRAGCGHVLLVATGNGEKARIHLAKKHIALDYMAQDLYDAVTWILNRKAASP